MLPITKNDPPETSVAHGCSDTGEVPPPEATTSVAVGRGGAALPATSHEGAVGTNIASVGVSVPKYPPTYPPNSSPRPRSHSGPKFSTRLFSSPESVPGDASRAPINYMAARPRPRRSRTSHDVPAKLIPQGESSNPVRASTDEHEEESSEDEEEDQAERSGDKSVVGVGQWDVLEKGEGKRHWKGTKSGTRERREAV
ncbi:hypothetical protein IQ07DRAFT_593139 [Pyrenochaeta sp. DS3sAY3a]|nr:hypothetical protein IQ07DRAFT_593139 [Pyrenochaeta sp. DS3sAY3a]